MHRWDVVQHELIRHLGNEIGQLTPRLEKLIHVLEWIRIEEWTAVSWRGIGRPGITAILWRGMPMQNSIF